MSGKLVLSNVVVLEGEELQPCEGHIVIREGVVEKISEGSPAGPSKNMKGAVIIPLFFNAHVHLGDSRWKEVYLGKPQSEVVGPGGLKHRLLEGAGEEEVVSAMRTSLRSMLASATAGFCDFREQGIRGLRMLRRALRPPLKAFVLGRGGTLEECLEVLSEADGIGAPSLDFLSWPELRKVAREARRRGKMFAVHVSETREAEVKSIRERGEGELSAALRLGPSFLVHATHSGEEDLKKARRRKVPIVFCPRANRLLSAGSPPIAEALDLDLTFWLGSDNVSVCEPDMFEVMRSAWECVRAENPSADGEDARRLLASATVGPSKFFLGSGPIEEGGDATFAVLARRENLQHVENVFAGIVNRAGVHNIRWIFVKGKRITPES